MNGDKVSKLDIPKTMEEAVERVINALKPEELNKLLSAPKGDLPKFHFDLGLWIRNNFKLFDNENPLIKDIRSRNPKYRFLIDPDEISTDIIEAVWEKLHDTNYMTELSDKAMIDFLHHISKSEKDNILAVKLINERIQEGESLQEIFREKSGFSLCSHKISDNEDTKYKIKFGCSAGSEAGDGGEWEVVFDKDDNIKECNQIGQWIS